MSRSAKWLLLPALGLLLAIGVVACAKKAEVSASTSTSAPASGPVTVDAVELGRSIGSDKQVTEKLEAFKPNDTIYASIRTRGASPNAKLGVKWTFQDGALVDQSEQMIAPDGAAATEFHITKPDGFPAGSYKLEVFVDGRSVQTRDFRVTAS